MYININVLFRKHKQCKYHGTVVEHVLDYKTDK